MAVPVITHMASLFGWLCSLPVAVLSRCSTFLAFPGCWGVQCSFGFSSELHDWSPLRGCPRGIQSCYLLPGFPGFPLKSEGKLLIPQNSCILCAYKTSTTWMTQRYAASGKSSWVPLDHGCSGLWVPERLNMVKWIQGNKFAGSPVWADTPRVFSSPRKVFQMSLCFYTLESRRGGILVSSWDVLKASFPLS
jgi:hypothetical protein